MPRFAANLTLLFADRPFPDRFAAAAACGFRGVEFLFPYAWDAGDLAHLLMEARLEPVLFNLPPGDWDGGERGLAALPGREAEFRASVALALDYARVLGVPRMHVMAGVPPADAPPTEVEDVYVENLRFAADQLAGHGLALTIEPINTRDMPGYALSTTAQACRVLDRVGRPNARLRLDLYHAQIMEGDLSGRIERLFDRIEHIQIAGHPGRNEPDTGEIRYPPLFALLDRLGYRGWVGCEYRPRGGTAAGLGWAAAWGIGSRREGDGPVPSAGATDGPT